MGYCTTLYRMFRPQQSDVNHDFYDGNGILTWRVDTETRKALIEMGLENLMIKRAGNYYIGIEQVDSHSFYPNRYNDDFRNDYYNPNIRNQSIRLGWDVILTKERAEEFCKKYINNKECYKHNLIDPFIEGETIILREW